MLCIGSNKPDKLWQWAGISAVPQRRRGRKGRVNAMVDIHADGIVVQRGGGCITAGSQQLHRCRGAVRWVLAAVAGRALTQGECEGACVGWAWGAQPYPSKRSMADKKAARVVSCAEYSTSRGPTKSPGCGTMSPTALMGSHSGCGCPLAAATSRSRICRYCRSVLARNQQGRVPTCSTSFNSTPADKR